MNVVQHVFKKTFIEIKIKMVKIKINLNECMNFIAIPFFLVNFSLYKKTCDKNELYLTEMLWNKYKTTKKSQFMTYHEW